jgi:uncharacterized protein (TIGR02231 family)
MKTIMCLLLFLALNAKGKDIELKTKISDVTVFQTGAQVKRIGNTTLKAGENDIVISDATLLLKKESIQVKGEGDFTILSVNYQSSIDDLKLDKVKCAELELKENELKNKMEDITVKIEVLRNEEIIILNLQAVSTTTVGITVDQVVKAQEILRTKLLLIKNEKLAASRQMKQLYEEHQAISQQLTVVKTPKQNIVYEIIVRVLAKKETKAEFELSYIVPNAKWFPTYDLRVKTVLEPLVIDYKANVTQQTGEDWNNVKLKLSTGDPSLSSQKPKIETWWLELNEPYYQPKQQSNYYKYTDAKYSKINGKVMDKNTGEPMAFCNVMVEGTNIGTNTDFDGKFSLVLPENAKNIKVSYVGYNSQVIAINSEMINVFLEESEAMLSEIAVFSGKEETLNESSIRGSRALSAVVLKQCEISKVSRSAIEVSSVLNIVSTEFNIEEKYSIISDPKNIVVSIQSITTDAKYQYYCAPRLDKDVFITAQLVNWEQYNLLEGQANVFFEGTFVGNTLLDTRFLTDTLEISLGRDKSVKIERKKSKDFNRHNVFGNDNIAYRDWDITVRNGKQQPINIIIEDQFPMSEDSKVIVTQEEKGDGKLNETTGIVTWPLKLDPVSTKKLQLKYKVKYPKGNMVGLD